MKLTLKQMAVFTAIVKAEGNMTLAAQSLYLTQSACSMALSNFENQLGSRLFERRGKKLVLNEVGREVYLHTLKIVRQTEDLEYFASEQSSQNMIGHLVISASSTIGNYVLPEIILEFTCRYPNIKISLKVANTSKVIEHLTHAESDLGFVEGSCSATELEVLPWLTDQLVIIAAKNHPLAKTKSLTLEALYEARWILREEGSGTREKFEKALEKPITPFLELGHTEAIKQAILTGLGISCLSKTAVDHLLQHKELVELKCPSLTLKREFNLVIHKEKYRSHILKMFIEACAAHAPRV